MADETAFGLLQWRRRELTAQIAALKGQLAPKEAEVAQIDKALAILEPPPASVAPNLPQKNSNVSTGNYAVSQLIGAQGSLDAIAAAAEQMKSALTVPQETIDAFIKATSIPAGTIESFKKTVADIDAAIAAVVIGPTIKYETKKYETMTIKELVVQALIDHFPKGGTVADIRDFIRLGYGRTIEPSSMRPQMHRLRGDGIIGQDPANDTWDFQDGKRRLYAMYDHPTSRANMKELKDDTVEDDLRADIENAIHADAKQTIAGGGGAIKRRKL